MPRTLSLSECLRHFAERFTGRQNVEHRRSLARFTGASYDNSVVYWLAGKYLPVGLNKWKTIAFFHLIGYPINEFDSLQPDYQTALVLLGCGLTDPKELGGVFGYSGPQVTSQLFVVLSNNTELSAEKQATIKAFVAEHQDVMAETKASVRKQYQNVLYQPVVPVAPSVAPLPAPREIAPADITGLDPRSAAASLAYQIKAMLPLAEFLESDAVSDSVRDELRMLSAPDAGGVFKLANILHRLCGPRGRDSLRQKKGQ